MSRLCRKSYPSSKNSNGRKTRSLPEINSIDDMTPVFDSEESDSPCNCDICHEFIESSLTSDGEKYVIEECSKKEYSENSEILKEWEDYFSYLPIEEERNRIKIRKAFSNNPDSFQQSNGGTFSSHSSIGFYPLYYITKENNILCADCATKSYKNGDDDYPKFVDVNYEDTNLYCEDCGENISAAYSE